MTTTQRRIALLAGASISALGISSPVLAAPHYPAAAPHEDVSETPHPGVADTTDDTLVICDIADNADCFLGDTDTGSGPQTATVNSVATGQIKQNRAAAVGPESISIENAVGDYAEIGAYAYSTNSDATANLSNAISQTLAGDDDVTATVDNNGTLLIDSLAVSSATSADAVANLDGGILQSATSTGGDVTLNVTNDGPAFIVATAVAFGETDASAQANLDNGIVQSAAAYGYGTASNNVTNNNSLNIGAYAIASATEGPARAYAGLNDGIEQDAFASGGGDAVNSISNNGTLTIAASALATGTNSAYASAGLGKSGIAQSATAQDGGNASNTITNASAGVINIAAHATAYATAAYGSATAHVELRNGITQNASATDGGYATNTITNAGTINIGAAALARAGTEGANAFATADNGIAQSAVAKSGDGNAANVIANSGTITISANATADADGGFASAYANNDEAIDQDASATGAGNAANTLDSHNLTISANALASGEDAHATASVGADVIPFDAEGAISQEAFAYSGDASNLINNDGMLTIAADAAAHGATHALANANVRSDAIHQSASVNYNTTGDDGGDANSTITNAGALTISADAAATAAVVGAGVGNATANATIETAVSQLAYAYGGGDALAYLTNTAAYGSISVNAVASAKADGEANANASIDFGLYQFASATQGYASASIDNAGAISISAAAHASGSDANADADVGSAIWQTAYSYGGKGASVVLNNDGTIDIAAAATANGTTASADASVSQGVFQSASATGGGDASVTLTNAGALTISAVANADASDGAGGGGAATADARVVHGISQNAFASGYGSALASITNGAAAGVIDISAVARAHSTTAEVSADADVSSGIYQFASASQANATVNITNGGTLNIAASAYASGSTATAEANVEVGIFQSAIVTGTGEYGTGDALASLSNSGDLTISAVASADSTRDSASATAEVTSAIYQHAEVIGEGYATALVYNTGTLAISASANAVANDYAFASAYIENAIGQSASVVGDTAGNATGVGNASVDLTNGGTLSITAVANATGNSATAIAYLDPPIGQYAYVSGEGDASATITNEEGGVISITADAIANASVNDAYAYASLEDAILQSANVYGSGDALASIANGGSMTLSANATANGATYALASAQAGPGGGAVIHQSANADGEYGTATAAFSNSGTLAIAANANAYATSGAASAFANVGGDKSGAAIYQLADGESGALDSITNAGAINVSAVAHATGTAGAVAHATAVGAIQTLPGGGTASFYNSGTAAVFSVLASANASATDGSASASARAAGVSQHPEGGLAAFANEGVFSVAAAAFATGTDGEAHANAAGYNAVGTGVGDFSLKSGTGQAFEMDWTNSGSFTVSASATAPAAAYATAVGINAQVFGPDAEYATEQAGLSGSILNSAMFSVLAHASGGTTIEGTGEYATTVALSQAVATGINLNSGTNTMEVTNSGTFNVEAMTANGGDATATGIRVVGNGTGLPPTEDDPDTADVDETDVFTFTNDGGVIRVRQSSDGGASWQRGLAIDVDEAPNPSIINLLGDGDIYGNVEIAGTDLIRVADGETSFDGIVGPGCIPEGGASELVLDSEEAGEGSNCGVGTLTIEDGGTLFLRDRRNDDTFADMYDGPSYVFVEEFNVNEGGTIAFEFSPTTFGDQPVGTYPQVFADVANLEGTLEARFVTTNNLYDDLFYDNVIDANERNGGFDGAQCVLGGDISGSLLLELDCIEDDDNNIDIALNRIAFNDVPGLNGNGEAVGEGLECIFDPDLTGGMAELLADLFIITDAGDYNTALNQLSGSSYANYLNSFQSLGVHYNDLADKATSCEVPALAGSVLECRASSPLHLWGQVDYQYRKTDGDSEAGSSRAKRWTALVGIDASVGNAAILGASIGKVTNHVRDRQFGDNIDADGFQVGAYAVYDPGNFYVKGVTTYSWFDGDSRRQIDFGPFGGTFAGTTRGDPDVKLWTFGLHGGARVAMSESSVLTPYLNLDYVSAKMDEFIESGLEGADLHLANNKENRTFLTAGVKWATQMGGVVPEVNLGYRHRFGDRFSNITEAFMCQTDTCAFDVVSATEKRGAILAGLSIGGKMGLVDLRLGYEGEFNSDVRSHSGNFKVVVPLGGRAAPPPPPPVVETPPPPPPPPPATQTCPDGSVILATDACPVPPPPPPPPPPAPERG